ncbi:AMP-binding enzyme domain-containing protein [Sarocladium implicatum]|nr:AMP-binding enzyme domain-containing protein [Sarocladium implicatum]
MDSATSNKWHEAEQILLQNDDVQQATFVDLSSGTDKPDWAVALSYKDSDGASETSAVKAIRKTLRKKLDGTDLKSQIPKKWVVLPTLPTDDAGNVDARALRQQLMGETSEGSDAPTATTIRKIVADVLDKSLSQISTSKSFVHQGGDSISAIEIMSSCLERNIFLEVKDILGNYTLAELAATADKNSMSDDGSSQTAQSFDVRPFELLGNLDATTASDEVRKQCNLPENHTVEDVYPCTALQEGLMALAVKQPGSYIHKNIYELDPNVDIERLREAWAQTLPLCENLRTRIVMVKGKTLQAKIDEEVSWEDTDGLDLKQAIRHMQQVEMTFGTRMCRYATVTDTDGKRYFIWVVHHAVFDGWTHGLIMDLLTKNYLKHEISPIKPYNAFIKHVMNLNNDAAADFWSTQLQSAQRATFPSARAARGREEKQTRVITHTIDFKHKLENSITKATVLRAAWAIVLARYCDTNDICFGTTLSGRNAPVPGLRSMTGPVVATVPARIVLDQDKKIPDFLADVQNQALQTVTFEQYGLQNIMKLGPDAADACEFSSLLVIQPFEQIAGLDDSNDGVFVSQGSDILASEEGMQNYFNYPLVVQLSMIEDAVELVITYDMNILAEEQLLAMSEQFNHVVQQLATLKDKALASVTTASSWDLEKATKLNPEDPDIIDACFHDLIEQKAAEQPDAMAVKGWDASFTYAELNRAANRLAHHLVNEFGVKPDDLVHVCFEKSAWYVVSILAINKAGGAWVPLDPSHPEQRQKQVVEKSRASLALVGSSTADMSRRIVANVIEVTPELDERLKTNEEHSETTPQTGVTPRNAVYVLFTSGSTGTPKGFVMEHGGVMTMQNCIRKRLRITPEVRSLQFASYVFDMSVVETLAPLISGACIHVPSEHTRMNGLKEFVRDNNINWLFMTPAFARTLKPEDYPSVELLLFAGEAVGRDVFEMWFGKARLINGWGPAEVCCFATLHEWTDFNESSITVGTPIACNCWIVDPDDPSRLAPIGTMGEVMVQGPAVLREYLTDPERTAAATITELPEWTPRRKEVGWDRFYKSGDLCFYNADGTIEFGARKDTQVKIRGLRVELGEVEHHVRAGIDGLHQVAVDVFRSDAGATLVAYLFFGSESRTAGTYSDDEVFEPITPDLQGRLNALLSKISVALPRYMVPTMYIPCKFMPFITSTKLDRKSLQRVTQSLSQEDINKYGLADGEKRAPETDMEKRLQSLWAEVLNISRDSIGRDDSFLRIGGDSIAAIYFVTQARDEGIEITVKDIFDDPRLIAVAAKAREVDVSAAPKQDLAPFELLDDHMHGRVLSDEVREQCGLADKQEIYDAYPCTALQEGLMALTVKQKGAYITQYFNKVPEYIEITRFKAAWEKTLQQLGNMHTRIVRVDETSLNALVKDEPYWEPTEGMDLRSFMKVADDYEMTYGSRLVRYALVNDPSGDNYFVWVIHHSVVDGWTLRIIHDTLHSAYWDLEFPVSKPYSGFIQFTESLDPVAASDFWQAQLQGAQQPKFPPRALPSESAAAFRCIEKTVDLPQAADTSITKATIVRAAWAMLLSRYSDTDDICFGTTVSGRNAPVPGLETMAGPAIATVPVRVQFDRQQTVQQYLQAIQSQASDMILHEQFGLQNISRLSPDAKTACDFTSLLVIQPTRQFWADTDGSTEAVLKNNREEISLTLESMHNYFNYPIVLLCNMFDDHVDLQLFYNSTVLNKQRLDAVSNQFEHVVHQLLTKEVQEKTFTGDVSLVGDWDIEHALSSSRLRSATESCAHWMIQKQIDTRPEDAAISAWDGELSYAQLGLYASRLAVKLQELGVGPDVLVPFCFPKSTWAAVTMVAIEIAGGAFVPLDPKAPAARLQGILEDTQAKLVITSPETEQMIKDLGLQTFSVSEDILKSLPEASEPVRSATSPSNLSFVIYTSGSTGKPKGVVHDHKAICSSSDAYGADTGIGPGTRVFAFSAYTFDVGVLDVLVSLTRGACLCIPSEHDRVNDLAGAFNRLKANWAFLTPTVADLLEPSQVPDLKFVGLGGEAPTKQVVDKWRGTVSLHGLYGPAESSICAWKDKLDEGKPNNIGVPLSSAFWVTEPENPKCLVPVGCVGELLIQGPLLAKGYLNNPEGTADVWIEDASWFPGSSSSRAYRTGDLVRRNEDGTFEYMGRKDTQVKLHGQRIELGEIESRVHDFVPGDIGSIVEIVKDENDKELLMALLWYTSGPNSALYETAHLAGTLSNEACSLITDLDANLNEVLPSYMVPSNYLIFHGKPEKTTSGKVDRRALVKLASQASVTERQLFATEETHNEPPTDPMEFKLRGLWAQVLNLDAGDIGKNDSFLRIGGDSLSAIQLVTLAHKHNVSLTVGEIFEHPRLCQMAIAVDSRDEERESYATEPFGLVPDGELDAIMIEARRQCDLSDDAEFDDIYPASFMQEGLMSLAAKQPGSYIAKHVYRIPDYIDLARFKSAWEKTCQLCTNMRTRLIEFKHATYQVVIKDDLNWVTTGKGLRAFMEETSNAEVGIGKSLSRFALVRDGDENYFVNIIHHSVFDGWSMRLVNETLKQVYNETEVPSLERYANFANYTTALDWDAATDYWKDQLHDARKASFPEDPADNEKSRSLGFDWSVRFPESKQTSITKATVVKAAWALVLARYSETDDICFGASTSGRQAAVPGIENMPGPTIATVPIRVRLDMERPVSSFLADMQQQATDMVPYEQYGLQNIAKLGEDAKDASRFSSLMLVQPGLKMHVVETDDQTGVLAVPSSDKFSIKESLAGYFSYPLVLQAILFDDRVDLEFTYHSAAVSESQLAAMSRQMDHVIQQLLSEDDKALSSVSLAGPWDLEQAKAWNSELALVESTVPDLLAKQAAKTPDSEAVWTTEGVWTHIELDRLANQFAHYLVGRGVKRGSRVPLCFEKSRWAIVAFMGIMKAGGAFIPLDPAHPKDRRQGIAEDVSADFMVVSPETKADSLDMVGNLIELSPALLPELEKLESSQPPLRVTPDDDAYFIFTSGSTGKPKGVHINHRQFATALQAHGEIMEMCETTRWLQFSAYVFDGNLAEMFTTLLFGGTTCVPTDKERLQSTADFINRSETNLLFVTPSFLRTLTPGSIPTVKKLLIGGEPVGPDNVKAWFDHVESLHNVYGPTETTIFATLHRYADRDERAGTIGTGLGNRLWITEPDNINVLTPIGCIGELVIQGHTVANGYLNMPEATDKAFADKVDWLDASETPARFYRTGDLRMELAEVEAAMEKCTGDIDHAAADILKTESRQILIGFVDFKGSDPEGAIDEADMLLPMDDVMRKVLTHISEELKETLPAYMVPSLLMPLRTVPHSTALKIDRKKLHAFALNLTSEQLLQYSLEVKSRSPPKTEMELKLRSLWSSVLGVMPDTIGRNDNFLRIGGDSITAIRLVSLAQSQGINLSAAMVFDDAKLSTLAAKVNTTEHEEAIEIEPFSMLDDNALDKLKDEVETQCGITDADLIEDAFPTTGMQSGLMALSVKQPGSYIAKFIFRIPDHIDIDQLKDAWERTRETCPNIRTRIIDLDNKAIQVQLKDAIQWEDTTGQSVRDFEDAAQKYEMTYGTPLNRQAIIKNSDGSSYFSWVSHHSVFDGWSVGLVLSTLASLYKSTECAPLAPYAGFIKHVVDTDHDTTVNFWKKALAGSKKASFPPTSGSQPSTGPKGSTGVIEKTIPFPKTTNTSITRATVLRAAWAMVLARYSNTEDICFGTTISGRNAPVPGLETMPGPVIATVPVRIKINSKNGVGKFLQSVQRQASDMVPYEQFGLSNISRVSEDAREACDFSSLLVVQTDSIMEDADGTANAVLEPRDGEDGGRKMEKGMQSYFSYPLVLQYIIRDEEVDILVFYDTAVLKESRLQALAQQVANTATQLVGKLSKKSSSSSSGKKDSEKKKQKEASADKAIM